MDKHIHQLEQQLIQLLAEHEAMLAMILRKHEALRQARPNIVSECTQRENQHVQNIGRIETARQQTVAELTRIIEPTAKQPLNLSSIAQHLDESRRSRLLALHARLRQTIERVQRQARITRAAMEGLLNHVQGIVQMLVQTVGGGGTYGRRGRIGTPMAASSFSTTV